MAARRTAVVAALALGALGALALAPRWPAALAVTLACVLVARHRWSYVRRALVGARSERRVGEVIESLRPAAVVHGADLGSGGDADHVVLGPLLAVVETKTGRGRLERRGDTLYVGGRPLARDPMRQAQHQARLLGRIAGRYVEAVVCIVDLEGPPQRSAHATVCSLADLPTVLKSLPRRIDPPAAHALAARLANAAAPPGTPAPGASAPR